MTLKEVKAFLPKINCKISTSKLRDIFQEVDTNKRGEIGFDDFSILYHKLIFDENVSNVITKQIIYIIITRLFDYCLVCTYFSQYSCQKIL